MFYQDRQTNGLNQLTGPTLSEFMNNEQTRYSNDILRDLPPKSPGARRLMTTIPTKVQRGEVNIYSECKYMGA